MPLYNGVKLIMPLRNSILVFLEYELFLIVSCSLKVKLISEATLSGQRPQNPLIKFPGQKSWGFTQQLKVQWLNNPLLSQEDTNITKRAQDEQSIPHMGDIE